MDALDAFKRFALSIDIINEELNMDIGRILERISTNTLGAVFFEVQKPVYDNEGQIISLKTIWSNGDGFDTPIMKNGKYAQTTYAYVKKKCLWINEESNGVLSPKSKSIDSWNIDNPQHDEEDFPNYWDFVQTSKIKTSVIIPLIYSHSRTPLGIVNFEFPDYLECLQKSKEILKDLARSISILVHLLDVRKSQQTHSAEAASQITALASITTNILKRPKVFVSFPNKKKNDVISVISKIEQKYQNEYDFVWWNKIHTGGNIMKRLMTEINESKYAIVYFSEEQEDGTFFDNHNVVYEAGMFQALKHSNTGTNDNWIPIRELRTTEIPFNYAQQYIVTVNRLNDGTINSDELFEELDNRFKAF